jgi:TonB family protein
MAEAWKEWEGQTVHDEFPLLRFLGGTNHSGVFLTERPAHEPRKAAIKLIPVEPRNVELELSRWARAANLQHPNLIRIFQSGRCQIAGRDLLFILMEYAEETLSQIIPERPLAPDEVRAMLPPVLDALACLHRQGFVHGRLKPSNILATGDELKLSSDGISRLGEPRGGGGRDRHTAYDPPEGISAKSTPSGDVWAIGVTLVEALTQRSPVSPVMGHVEPAIPDNLPEPFLEIARNCLHRDPQRRFSIAQISASLKPPAPAAPPAPEIRRPAASPPQRASARLRPRNLKPLVGFGLALLVIVAIPWLLSRNPESRPAATASEQSSSSPPAQSKPQLPAKSASQSAQKPSPRKSGESATVAAGKPQASAIPPSETASLRTQPESKPRPSTRAQGEVLQKVMPEVSQKSLATIQGKVRVAVRVQVDPSGEVTAAELASPGPSKYFADQALAAARRWKFLSPLVNDRDAASVWLLRFDFRRTGVSVASAQSAQ